MKKSKNPVLLFLNWGFFSNCSDTQSVAKTTGRKPSAPKDPNAPHRFPTSLTKQIFQHFTSKRVTKDALAAVEKVYVNSFNIQ